MAKKTEPKVTKEMQEAFQWRHSRPRPTAYPYPALRKVLDHMAADQGTDYAKFTPRAALAFLREHLTASNSMQSAPYTKREIDRVEAWLATLSAKKLETFSVGEREDMDRLLPKEPELRQLVEEVMDELFMAVGG